MALSTAECDAMIQASERSGARLAVGLLRRFAPTLRYTKEVIESGMLGTIRSFDVREGLIFRWPVKSAAMFSPKCGGVMADTGCHVLDLLLWWFGDVASFEYWDDAAGGVEADAVMNLEMASGVTGRIEMSRTRDLRNSCIIRGDRGTLEVGTKTASTVTLTPAHGHVSLSGAATAPNQQPPGNLGDLFAWQMADFVRAIQTNTAPSVPGSEGRRSVAVLENCYRRRQPLVFPFESLLVDAHRRLRRPHDFSAHQRHRARHRRDRFHRRPPGRAPDRRTRRACPRAGAHLRPRRAARALPDRAGPGRF